MGRHRKSNKGFPYEREICYLLSDWWSRGKRDDVFWRSSTSGARATTRAKKNKRTAGQSGDICATDPSGLPMTDVFAIECKRGYNKASPLDVIDRRRVDKEQAVESWVAQARTASQRMGTLTFLLIWRRDGHESCVGFDNRVLGLKIKPKLVLHVAGVQITFTRLDRFLKKLTPDMVKELSKS